MFTRSSPAGRTGVLLVLCGLALARPTVADADPSGSGDFEPQFQPTLQVSRTSQPISVDGGLDDPGWRGAARAAGFAEVSPGDQVKPPLESEAWVTYDDANLYVALIAYDDPEEVRVSVCERDDIFQDDYFGIMLDTYGDQTWGYELFVNPIGIQGDLRMQASGWEDISFDLIWESQGQVTGSGYQVEIAIPFASLRFPDRPTQLWRVNFWRDHQRDLRRRYAWSAIDRDNPCFLCQLGTLEGITNVKPGRALEMLASGISSQRGHLADTDDPHSRFDQDHLEGDAGLNLRYGLSTSSSAEVALNPDFSQVESDAGQIDVNTTFALFYSEHRPFFQEGSDLYDTWISAIYTRSVNDPDLAAKISGRFGKTGALYLFAHDQHTPLIIPFEERSDILELGRSYSNILRLKRSLWEDSFVGALVTDRRLKGGGGGTVVSMDALMRFLTNYYVELQLAASRTAEPDDPTITEDLDQVTFDDGRHTVAFDGERFRGRGIYASLERSARVWGFDLDYWEYDPSFRTDNGFTTRNDYRQVTGWTGLFFRPNEPWLVEWEPSVSFGRVWSHDNRFKDEWIRSTLWFNTLMQTDFGLQHLISKERFGPGTFPGIRIWSFWLNTRFCEMLSGGGGFNIGRGIYRDFDEPELAKQRNWNLYGRFRPSQNLEFQGNLNYARMDSRESGETLYSGFILRGRLNLNFTREWFLRLVVQYDEFDEELDIEPLLTYRINPFTVFYLGTASRFLDVDTLNRTQWRSSSRQYFAKLQYLFRL